MDLILIILGIVSLFSKKKIKLIKYSKKVIFYFYIYIIFCFIATVRGFFYSGTTSLTLLRYSLFDILWVFILVKLLDSQEKFHVYMKFIIHIILPIWIIRFAFGLDYFNRLISSNIGRNVRFTDAATAMGLAWGTIFVLKYLLNNRRMNFFLSKYNLIFFASLFFIILDQHRSVYVAMSMGVLLFIIFLRRVFKFQKIIFNFLVIFLITSIILFTFNFYFGQGYFLSALMSKRLQFLYGISNDPTGEWRLVGWLSMINYTVKHNFLFGSGFLRFNFAAYNILNRTAWAHNQFIHFFRVAGFLGLLSYIAIIIYSVQYGLKLIRSSGSKYINISIIEVIVSLFMTITYMLFYNQITFFWISIGLLFVIDNLFIQSENKFYTRNAYIQRN